MGLQGHERASADKVSFGEILRSQRTTHSPTLTQEDLAGLMHVSRALVTHIERGHRLPTHNFVNRAVEALDLSDTDAALLWEAAGFIPPKTPIPFTALETRQDVEEALPSGDLNPILSYLAHADVFALIEGWRLLAQADVAIRSGQYEQARDLCASVVIQRLATPTLRLFARRKLAEAYRQLGNLAAAYNAIAPETVVTDLPTGDGSPRAAFLNALLMAQRGEIALRRGQYQQGLEDFEASKKGYTTLLGNSSSDASEISESSAVIHLGLGMAFERMAKASLFLGDENQADAYCTIAKLHLDKATPSPQRSELQRKVVELRAWALARRGDFENAIALHEQARDAAETAGDTRGVLKNCVYLGDDWRRRAEKVIENLNHDNLSVFHPLPPRAAYTAAQKRTNSQIDVWVNNARISYKKAMRLMNTHPDPYMMGLCLRNLGIIARFQDNFAEADALLDRAERFDNNMNLDGRLPAIHEARGDLYCWQEVPELAIKWYTRALEALDKLLPAAKAPGASSEESLSPDERRETLLHTRERRRVLASLEALLPLPAAQHALDRWRPEHRNLLDEQWGEATDSLAQCVIEAIQQGRGVLATTSDSDLTWVSELADFEEIPGPRILAQNSLSAGWSDTLPEKFVGQSDNDNEVELAAATDAFQRRRARIGKYVSAGYRDLAAEATVLNSLTTPDDRASARRALALLEQSRGAYTLTLSRLPLPLAFTVKGDRVLAEVPVALLDALLPAATAVPSTQDLDSAIRQDAIWCYRFDDPDLARDLTTIFNRLEAIAVKQGGGNAATTLRQRLSTKPEQAKRSGI